MEIDSGDSHSESKGQSAGLESLDMRELMLQMMAMMQQMCKEKNITHVGPQVTIPSDNKTEDKVEKHSSEEALVPKETGGRWPVQKELVRESRL